MNRHSPGATKPNVAPAEALGGPKSETLAQSVTLLLAITVVQRALGFGRGVLFCRWLNPEELGQWDLAIGFLTLAAPVAVLGLPGSFGRYLEYYRNRGQSRKFLRRMALCVAAMALVAIAFLGLGGSVFSQLIFGRPDRQSLVSLIALCLLMLIFYNFLFELFGGLRMFRLVSILQFCHSLMFATLGVSLLLFWRADATSVMLAYGAACALCVLGAVFWLRGAWGALPADNADLKQRDLWRKLVPFAASVWVTNWLANLFEIADRYMLVHFSDLGVEQALGQVGAYHAARVLPLPMIAVAALLRSAVLPHLSQDWEAGRRDRVNQRLNLTLKLVSLTLFAGSVAILLVAPLVFDFALAGKFPGGLAVLPLTLVYLSWAALATLASIYLWCAERAGLGSVALAVGLLGNIGLNLLLVPSHGLFGAVLATTIANLIALTLVLGFSQRLGMRVHVGVWIVPAATASVTLGPAVASAALLALVHQAATREWLFDESEKRRFLELAAKLIPLPGFAAPANEA